MTLCFSSDPTRSFSLPRVCIIAAGEGSHDFMHPVCDGYATDSFQPVAADQAGMMLASSGRSGATHNEQTSR